MRKYTFPGHFVLERQWSAVFLFNVPIFPKDPHLPPRKYQTLIVITLLGIATECKGLIEESLVEMNLSVFYLSIS